MLFSLIKQKSWCLVLIDVEVHAHSISLLEQVERGQLSESKKKDCYGHG